MRQALLVAGLVVLLLVLPIVLGMHPLGSPAFDITADPAGPLPF